MPGAPFARRTIFGPTADPRAVRDPASAAVAELTIPVIEKKAMTPRSVLRGIRRLVRQLVCTPIALAQRLLQMLLDLRREGAVRSLLPQSLLEVRLALLERCRPLAGGRRRRSRQRGRSGKRALGVHHVRW